MMEHRLGRRLVIDVPVRVDFQDGTSGWGLATDIGQGGLYVSTAARPQRDGNGCVDVHMTVAMPAGERSVLLRAAVVHRGDRGFGVMFRRLDRGAETLVAWLLGTDHREARFAAMAARPAPALVPAEAIPPPTAIPRRCSGAAAT
jgi:hypothetical protein